jgi:hypothetical protein
MWQISSREELGVENGLGQVSGRQLGEVNKDALCLNFDTEISVWKQAPLVQTVYMVAQCCLFFQRAF